MRDFRAYADGGGAARRGAHGHPRPQRRRQDEPARGAVLRLHRRARAGRSNEREVIRFGARPRAWRSTTRDRDGAHAAERRLPAGRGRSGCRSTARRGAAGGQPGRPLVCVFLPDRLELVKGAPALRRAHLDQVVAALWPSRAATRKAYARALAQRNALLAPDPRRAAPRASSLRRGTPSSRATASRCAPTAPPAVEQLAEPFAARPPSSASTARRRCATGRARSAGERRGAGRASWPSAGRRPRARLHRARPAPRRPRLQRDGRELRVYGSQGEQRLALLALLLAEREALGRTRGARR